MTKLPNPKHEIFAQEVASGKTAEGAYIAAGYAPKYANKNAHRMTVNEGICARIHELQSETAAKLGVNLETIVAEIEKTRVMAIALGQSHTALNATITKARLLGII